MKSWYLYILSIFFFAFAACVSEGDIDDDYPKSSSGTDLTVRIVFPATTGNGFSTRAISAIEENEIDTLDVFVFKDAATPTPSNTLDDIFLYRLSLPHDSIQWDGTSTNESRKKVTLKMKNIPGVQQRIVCVANMPAGVNLNLTENVSTEADLISQLKFSAAPWQTAQNSGSGNYTPIPMWGQRTDFLTITNPFTPPSNYEINMVRSLAKVEIGVDINGPGDPALGFGTIFKLDSIYVCNVSDSAYIAPHDDYINATVVDKTRATTVRKNYYGFKYLSYPLPSGAGDGRTLKNTIYVPETDSLIGYREPGFLVIKAHYYDGSATDTAYYYRIDFTDGTNSQSKPILRNHRYSFDIQMIRLAGYKTLAAAMAAPWAKNYAVVVGGGGGPDEEINDISVYTKQYMDGHYDQYMLGVSTSEVMYDWQGRWLGNAFAVGSTFFLKFYTDYQGGYSYSVDPGTTWLTSMGSGSGATPAPYEVLGMDYLSPRLNITGEERTAEITLTAGLLTKKIKVRQSGGANCDIIRFTSPTPGTQAGAQFSLSYASKARQKMGLSALVAPTPSPPYTASILWSEGNVTFYTPMINYITTPEGPVNVVQVNVEPNTGTQGNAVVVLKNASNEILWSWHVWVMAESSPDNVYVGYHNMNKSVMMDRPLGLSNSKYPRYQWGRKDPFMMDATLLSGSFSTAAAWTGTVLSTGVDNSIKNPNVFLTASTGPYYNWLGNIGYNNFWNETDGKKSYFDPCPVGWRVPTYNNADVAPWQNEPPPYTNIVFSRQYFSGFNGAASGSGDYFWSATPRGYEAIYCHVSSTTSLTAVANSGSLPGYRAHGMGIRCVKDISKKY